MLLWSSLIILCLALDLQIFSCFSLKSSIVLYFTLKSMIHLELIFMQIMRQSEVLFFLSRYPTAPVSFVEKPAFLQLNRFCTFVKNQSSILVCIYFWVLYSWSTDLREYTSSNAMWFCYSNYIIGLKKIIPLTLFFFKIVLSIVVPLSFHTNFRIILSICTKYFAGILIRIANIYKSVHQFGKS